VDIDPDAAPDKPCVCFGDISRNLLLCSNTTALYYEWWINDTKLVGTSENPYFYLTTQIKKDNNIDNSTIFTVRIANQLTGCYTTGYMCEEQVCSGNELANLPVTGTKEGMEIAILDNPVRNELHINTSGTYTGRYQIKVYSMSGTEIFSDTGNKTFTVEDHSFSLGSGLNPGIYLVVAEYGGNRAAPVKIIVY
jgi:hypothetical protein